MIVTIDGTVGSGKSTAAGGLARRLGAVHLDTGAMYRAVTLKALLAGTDLEDEAALARLAAETQIDLDVADGRQRVLLDGRDVTGDIRQERVSAHSHYVARARGVRGVLVEQQRAFAVRAGNVVAEGRDQGTVVFPKADVKFYLDADPQVRARRRQMELEARGEYRSFRQVLEDVLARDRRDSTREASPLKAAADAVRVDTSDLSIEATVDLLEAEVRRRGGAP
jgi:cytidylate kinase